MAVFPCVELPMLGRVNWSQNKRLERYLEVGFSLITTFVCETSGSHECCCHVSMGKLPNDLWILHRCLPLLQHHVRHQTLDVHPFEGRECLSSECSSLKSFYHCFLLKDVSWELASSAQQSGTLAGLYLEGFDIMFRNVKYPDKVYTEVYNLKFPDITV